MSEKLLVVQVAAMGAEFSPEGFHTASSVFPAVTCTVQATFRTASAPERHGMVANGVYLRDLKKALFWEQSASLVSGDRIWKNFRAAGKRVGMMFWQQSLGEDIDLVLSPAPIHKHSGGMVQDCYSKPVDLYPRLTRKLGRSFNLMNYWGPLASRRSSDWIVEAACAVMGKLEFAPDLLFVYIPHLDYALQSAGPGSVNAERSKKVTHELLAALQEAAVENDYEWLIFGDYAMESVRKPVVFPNRDLRKAGLLNTRNVRGMLYGDYYSSPAFAMVDHQIAHVYTIDVKAAGRAAEVLRAVPGIDYVLDRSAQNEWKIAHPRSGDLVLVASAGTWFAYPWWENGEKAPDFASHVDIHNKPGYDPCELFFGWPPPNISFDVSKVKGSHGRIGSGTEIAWKSSLEMGNPPRSLIDLSNVVRRWLDSHS